MIDRTGFSWSSWLEDRESSIRKLWSVEETLEVSLILLEWKKFVQQSQGGMGLIPAASLWISWNCRETCLCWWEWIHLTLGLAWVTLGSMVYCDEQVFLHKLSQFCHRSVQLRCVCGLVVKFHHENSEGRQCFKCNGSASVWISCGACLGEDASFERNGDNVSVLLCEIKSRKYKKLGV